MLTPRFRDLLEQYHRKKWYPENYPDPYGEFIEYISNGMVSDLQAAWEREKRGSYLDATYYILQLLPEIQLREIFVDYRKALLEPFSSPLLSEFAFFWIRNSPEDRASELWNDLQKWAGKWESVLWEWAGALFKFESSHAGFYKAYAERLQLPAVHEEQLRVTRDLFGWQFQNRTGAGNYWQLLRYFRLEHWKNIAEWNDLPALAKSVAETCGIPKTPDLKTAQNPAVQFLFPVLPPGRVILEHGLARGPFDVMRFLVELGKGFFYTGMNPDNPVEQRLCGDPSLPWFWGYMFASLLADSEATKTFIGLKAETMPDDTGFVLQCWYRYEVFLAIYRSRTAADLKNEQDLYVALWELAYPVAAPLFLSLYDLCRSTESIFRWIALHRSQTVIKHLRSKYGYKWFANKKWTDRARDYWWEGYRITAADILADLQVQDTLEYPF